MLVWLLDPTILLYAPMHTSSFLLTKPSMGLQEIERQTDRNPTHIFASDSFHDDESSTPGNNKIGHLGYGGFVSQVCSGGMN